MADYSIWVLEYSYVTKYHKSGVLYGAHNQGSVNMHAHFDHFGNVEDFPKATFYIQEREITKWTWAMSLPDRLRWMMVAVDPGDIVRGVQLAAQNRLTCIDGDAADVLPNIDLHVAYDSHTFASMWVAVRNDGKADSSDTWALAGDLVHVLQNFQGQGGVWDL